MSYGPDQHHRRSIRLSGYDYAQPGSYFVTICTQGRECLFGEVHDGEMRLSEYGQVVHKEWLVTALIRQEIELDAFVVMPNHVHGIVLITSANAQNVGAHGRAPLHRKPRTLGALVAGFKSSVTKQINAMRGTPRQPLWQRNYYEHIIRGEPELYRVRQYIEDNPRKWPEDPDNPDTSER